MGATVGTIVRQLAEDLVAKQKQVAAQVQAATEANAAAARDRVPRNPGRATFQNITTGDEPFPVHFNPVSLQIALANTLDDSHTGGDRTQYVSKSSAKLTMDLVFDTTDTGSNVRDATGEVAAFMEADGKDNQHRTPPTVLFEWGAFKFQGIFESYRETVDFFSHDGVPLRATVNITMSRQNVVFEDEDAPAATTSVDVPESLGNASQIAGMGGNPDAGRGLAAANGLESMRFSTGPISVDASVKLSPPVAFAGASAGIGAGIGIGLGAGVGAKTSGPSFGGSASAGLSASQGAFAGLRAPSPATGPALDPSRLVPRPQPRAVATGLQAGFAVGGQASSTGSASLGTDVGGGSASARVRFDGGR
jgi:hypothetical protein